MTAEVFARQVMAHLGAGPCLLVGDEAAPAVAALLAYGVDARACGLSPEVAARGNATAPGRFVAGPATEPTRHVGSCAGVVVVGAFDGLGPDDLAVALAGLRAADPLGLMLVVDVGSRPDVGIAEARPRVWWEKRCFEAGLRRHPRTLQLRSPRAAGLDRDGAVVLCEPVPKAALDDHPLSRLMENRSLHMDMSREGGSRSDAHVRRYDWAKRWIRPGDRVLDAACGLGYGAWSLLRQSGAAEVVAVDNSAYAIDYARLAFPDPRLSFRLGDLPQALDDVASDSIDCVVSFETIEHVPDPAALLDAFARVLSPAGRLVASVPHDWSDETGRDPNPHHFDVYDWPKLRGLLERRFLIDGAAAQTADRAKVDGVWVKQGPSVAAFDPELKTPDRPAEWLLATAMKPFHEAGLPPFPHAYRVDGDDVLVNPIDYPAMLETPWLSKGLLNAGMRLGAPASLRSVTEAVIRDGRPKDRAAALTIAGYRLAEDDAASAEAVGAHLAQAAEWIERHVVDAADPQITRWLASLTFLAGVLAQKIGDLPTAEGWFARCAAVDAAVFGPLLFSKSVEACHRLGWLRYGRGDLRGARTAWVAGAEAARRALALPVDVGADPRAARLDFVLSEYGMISEMGARCAMAIDLAERGGGRLDRSPVVSRPRERLVDLKAQVARLSAELAGLRSGAVPSSGVASPPTPGALPFPFIPADWTAAAGETTLSVLNGNRHCRPVADGFQLHANKPGRPAATYRAAGLAAAGRSRLTAGMFAGAKSPDIVARVSARAGDVATEQSHRLAAGGFKAVDLELPAGDRLEVEISVVVADGVASNSSAGLSVKGLRLA